ncbi:MAG: hypothetical protein JKX72_02315, partial [Robiginitomaculum sp.]|nr:hypothetical protein [Robiginitomaculum sp.]
MKACLTIGIIALYFSTYLTACQKIEAITLPQAVTNNAVAYHAPTQSVYSFAGLGADKDWRSVHANGFKCAISKRHCETIPPIPDGIGRLAATAQTIGDTIYIFGGYSVSEDGEEISMPEVWAYNVNTQTYSPKANMPVPVDDTVSILYQNRYIYLVSG